MTSSLTDIAPHDYKSLSASEITDRMGTTLPVRSKEIVELAVRYPSFRIPYLVVLELLKEGDNIATQNVYALLGRNPIRWHTMLHNINLFPRETANAVTASLVRAINLMNENDFALATSIRPIHKSPIWDTVRPPAKIIKTRVGLERKEYFDIVMYAHATGKIRRQPEKVLRDCVKYTLDLGIYDQNLVAEAYATVRALRKTKEYPKRDNPPWRHGGTKLVSVKGDDYLAPIKIFFSPEETHIYEEEEDGDVSTFIDHVIDNTDADDLLVIVDPYDHIPSTWAGPAIVFSETSHRKETMPAESVCVTHIPPCMGLMTDCLKYTEKLWSENYA